MGGTSYTSLALAQIPEIFFDYILLTSNPEDLFKPSYSLSSTKLLELALNSHSNRHFGFNSWLNNDSLFLNQLLSNSYGFSNFQLNNNTLGSFEFLERLSFYSSNPYKKLSYEIENIEYFDTSTVSYENFINIWTALITERIMFLDSVHNTLFTRQVERVWTNYIKYLDMHYAES
jgi:hypothetical protein